MCREKLSIYFRFSIFMEYRFLKSILRILLSTSIVLFPSLLQFYSFGFFSLPCRYFGLGFVNFIDFPNEPTVCYFLLLLFSFCFYFIDFSPKFDLFVLFLVFVLELYQIVAFTPLWNKDYYRKHQIIKMQSYRGQSQ